MLGDYLRAALARPWVWGEHDCSTFAAGWVIVRGHPDPMAFIRGQYGDEFSALRQIVEGGGLTALWTRGMADAGLDPIDEQGTLAIGDIGVIARPTDCSTNEATGIWSGNRWVTLGLRGLVSGAADPLIVWRP